MLVAIGAGGFAIYTEPVAVATESPGVGCALNGITGVLSGERLSDPNMWFDALEQTPGLGHVKIIFPVGYSARPNLQLLDPAGVVVAREGDHLNLVGGSGVVDGRQIWYSCGISPAPTP